MKVLTKFEVTTPLGVAKVTRNDGLAGAIQYRIVGPDGSVCFFVGSTYGSPGPVVLVIPNFIQMNIMEAQRFGPAFDMQWIINYLTHTEV